MKADPVRIGSLRKIKDYLTGKISLVIGVMNARGALVETVYDVTRAGTVVELVKEDGEVVTVESGGRCSCDDAKYRSRASSCKHVAACRLSGLLGVENDSIGNRASSHRGSACGA